MYAVDPSRFSIPGKTFSEEDYGEDWAVIDCKRSVVALAEKTIYSKTGTVIYHYKWSDPELLDMSTALPITTNSVAATAENILCHEKLRTPLVQKAELASMTFPSLSSTAAGDGDIFYKSIANDADYKNDRVVVIRENEDHSIRKEFFPNLSVVGLPPSYRAVVERVRVNCTEPKLTVLKSRIL